MKQDKYLTRKGYRLIKGNLTQQQIEKIRKELTVQPKLKEDYGKKPPSFKIFRENDTYMWIPRYYGIKNIGEPSGTAIKGDEINIKFLGTLRSYQVPITDLCLEKLHSSGGGVLNMRCASGKTAMALYIAVMLKQKTLVIVHKTFLQDQWYDRIKQFTNARIGIIRQSKVDIEDKDIVIAMLHSISMHDYDPEIFKSFGTLIFDEVHHAPAKVFSRALRKTGFFYTLGLSATLDRIDGLTRVIYWYIGDIMYQDNAKAEQTTTQVKQITYFSHDPQFVEKKLYTKKGLKPNMQKIITNICQIKDRNKILVDIITILLDADRKILLLSGRIEHLKCLKTQTDERIQETHQQYQTSFYIGEMKDYERKDSVTADIIFASFEMAEEGLDIPDLNTLMMVTPKSSIEQSVGRIMRKQNPEIYPLIIDIIDDVSLLIYQGYKRAKFYNKRKYDISKFYMIDNIIVDQESYQRGKKKDSNIQSSSSLSSIIITEPKKQEQNEDNSEDDRDTFDFID